MKSVDLHLHTRYSDGNWTPAGLVRAAAERGLAAIAITDHDSMDGIVEAQAAVAEMRRGGEATPEVMPGVEVTCCLGTHEVHLLGYFCGEGWRARPMQQVMAHARAVRRQRGEQIVARLAGLGVRLSFEEVLVCASGGAVGRPHVAMALMQRGYVGSLDEAFARFLRRGRPAFVERYRMSVAEGIRHIQRAGGAAVLAHPGLTRMDASIPQLALQGLNGIEAWHSRHNPSQTKRYRTMAKELGLIVTGGSDCHGTVRGLPPLLGSVHAPYDCLRALQDACAASSSRSHLS
jgi:predicted metal-dependent phosphoesterase TrpH